MGFRQNRLLKGKVYKGYSLTCHEMFPLLECETVYYVTLYQLWQCRTVSMDLVVLKYGHGSCGNYIKNTACCSMVMLMMLLFD